MIIVDAGVLYALADRRDAHHQACTEWFMKNTEFLGVVPLALAEACYLIATRCNAEVEAKLLEACAAQGVFYNINLTDADFQRMASLVRRYSDLPLGASGAAVMAVAERMDISTIATVDRRHFSVLRPRHCGYFSLVP